jgi:ribosome-binding protein aMBF1 (putative translation factor)
MATKKKRTSDAIRDLDEWIGDDIDMRRGISEAAVHIAAAQIVYDARTNLGWSQAELARRVGTKQSVISRIEDSDYDGHSLSSLQRIAFEMGLEVDVRFRKSRRVLGAPPPVAKSTGTAKKASRQNAEVRGVRASSKRRKSR